jgi:UDP-2,3-diacylglucosamine pyrophosphatase LpxH
MIIKRISRNVHRLVVHESKHFQMAMLSDLHWDNPKCDRDKLKLHLDYCLKHDMPIMINGDLFCLMQGRYDPRRSKKDIRAEHNTHDYIDAVINTAVDYFKPYAHLLTVIGYGNHETSIIKNLETDPLQRFVDLLNRECGTNVQTGGYGGWLIIDQHVTKTQRHPTKIKYFHGSGGGGIVTKGAINLTRALEAFEGFDIFSMGHIHENWSRNDVRDTLDYANKMTHKKLHLMVTGAYKEEYEDGFGGWHIERGAPPKEVGGRILNIYTEKTGRDIVRDSCKFPL